MSMNPKAMKTNAENGETSLHLALQHRLSKRSLKTLQLFVEWYPSAAGEATADGWIPCTVHAASFCTDHLRVLRLVAIYPSG
jgi:hypothetical protein